MAKTVVSRLGTWARKSGPGILRRITAARSLKHFRRLDPDICEVLRLFAYKVCRGGEREHVAEPEANPFFAGPGDAPTIGELTKFVSCRDFVDIY